MKPNYLVILFYFQWVMLICNGIAKIIICMNDVHAKVDGERSWRKRANDDERW